MKSREWRIERLDTMEGESLGGERRVVSRGDGLR